ncbi:MAG: SH3 domain-containing protein [Chloroflexia bacterium]|nr:SH3 domain-containing protein [Chloroflexia bacterium]
MVAVATITTLLVTTSVTASPVQPSNVASPAYVVSSADACIDVDEVAFLAMINEHRAASGARPLSVSASLSSAAAYHSIDMADKGYLAHTMLDGTSVVQNMANFGYEGGTHGENIAAGTATAAEAMQTWQGSAEHNANMLNGVFGAIGIGRAYDPASPYGWYWTTIFGDVSDGPGWLCGEAAPASKTVSLFQSVDGATSSSDVNLRTGPAAEYDVVTTLAPATAMTVTGAELNGFLPVKVDGQFGWVASEWVVRGPIAFEQTASPSQSGTATAIDAVELRSSPGDDGGMVVMIPAIGSVTLTGQAQDGFLEVVYEGQAGWADAAYLNVAEMSSNAALLQAAEAPIPGVTQEFTASPAIQPTAGSEATTTTTVNLRSQPNASAPVLSIVPADSPVTLTGSQANGYANVRTDGQAGWIDTRYLQ